MLLALVVSWQRRTKPPWGKPRPQGQALGPQASRPLSSLSQQTLKPQMTKTQAPLPRHFLSFLLWEEEGGPEDSLTSTRKAPLRTELQAVPQDSHVETQNFLTSQKYKLLRQKALKKVLCIVFSGKEMKLREGR